MHTIIQVFGFITAAFGALVLALSAASTPDSATGFIAGLTIGAPVILGGAVLYCFGAIVGHLIALRWTADRQLALFEQMVDRRQQGEGEHG